MDIKQLTQAMHDFVEAKGWYKAETARHQTARNLAASLSIEAAEVLEHFQWDDNIEDINGFSSELADVALYLLQLASVCNIDLEQAIMTKLKINYDRNWDQTKGK